MSICVINTHVSESRAVARIWLEGQRLAHAGVTIGVQYILNVSSKLKRIELRPAPVGFSGRTFLVSKRTRNETVYPLIELRDNIITELFEIGTKLRVAVQDGRIIISPSHIATRIQERVSRFQDKIKNNRPLEVVSLFHGGGVLDSALHEGMKRSKLASYVKVGVELEGDYLDSSLRNNQGLWREDSIVINGDVRDVNILGAGIPQVDMLVAGIPCTGASKSGKSKNKIACAEEHSSAGTLFHDFLNWVKVTNPSIVLVENVVEYLSETAMTVIRSVLSYLGYQLSVTVLDGQKLGSLEKRKRMCLVATTPGACGPIDFENLLPVRQKEETLAEILEDIPVESDRWKPYEYLAEKEVRDKVSGKGFTRQLLTGEDDGCGTIGRGYFKARSTEPFIVAPHNPALFRLLTEREHARVKTIPESLIEGLCATTAHEVLGQSVIYSAFVAVGELIARTVKGLAAPLAKGEEMKSPVAPKATQERAKPSLVANTTLPLFALSA